MTQRMKILGLRIKNYRQFKDFYLDFTEPNTDQALAQVCLIGANGTGKSSLLNLISSFLQNSQSVWLEKKGPKLKQFVSQLSAIAIRIQLNSQKFWILKHHFNDPVILPDTLTDQEQWLSFWNASTDLELTSAKNQIYRFRISDQEQLFDQIRLKANSSDLAIYATPDGRSHLPTGLPKTSLDKALVFFNDFKAFHISSYDQVEDFWNIIIYQIKKRERDELLFFSDKEVQNLTVLDAKEKFDSNHPEILTELAKQWDLILGKAGLAFDIDHAVIPVQTTENLQAYVKSIRSGHQISYNALSTGIRNFIFRIGHIYSLYFNREIQRGFLLLDEPEASLFPDLLYDIIERYQSIIQNTQFFVATQSPIIAAQFKPEERIILEFDDDHYVTCRRGISPEGDDPNDLLVNDFVVRSLYGKEGLKQWNRYLELRRTIPTIENPQEKRERLAEYARIGNTYNFAEHEISGET
ncbi:hypothetical protein Lepto7375DRAFT_6157 [Leptolyngbya sp. PCC 7375]|nr:hypothetical protein Lepto7375DRAFT_6157 [Leptolyngbya sp. PCC 7375]